MRILPHCVSRHCSSAALRALMPRNRPPTYKAADFKPAIQKHDPVPPKQTIVAAALPLPAPASFDAKAGSAIRPRRASTLPIAQALHEPTSDSYINAVQIYPFSDDALYRLYAAPQQVTDIALQPGETLSAISAGDTVRWAVGDTTSGNGQGRQVHVLVKPFRAESQDQSRDPDRPAHLSSGDWKARRTHRWRQSRGAIRRTASLCKRTITTELAAAVDSGIALDHLEFPLRDLRRSIRPGGRYVPSMMAARSISNSRRTSIRAMRRPCSSSGKTAAAISSIIV